MKGSVEIIQFGCATLDFSHRAPPMRGWASLRFAVSNLAAVLDRATGCAVIRPEGERCAALVTPWGARLEFFEAG